MKKQLLLSALLLAGLSGALRAQSVTLIDWNHQWKFFHPMGAMPANAGNFATTWYLPDAQYDSPLPFGAVPEVVGIPGTADRYDSGNGRSPLGYGTIDVANNAAFTSFGQTAEPSLFTTPDATRRYAGYFKTTFVVPAGGVSSPTLEFLCDDGGYVYLDGTLIASINITAGVADAYTSFAMNATDTETDTYVLNLSTGGARNLTGKLLATRLMPVNVTTAVPLLTAGTHTLAVSVHNNAVGSSDLVFAAKLTGTSGGCSFSTSAGAVTRDFNGTMGNPADDTITASITINPGLNNAPTWNVTANAPGAASNVTSGSYTTTHPFTFPVSTLVGGSVTLTFADAVDAACTSAVTLTAPPPPYILGKKRLSGVESDLHSSGPLATAWRNATPAVLTCNGTGSDRNTQELRSETIDLTGVARPVTVVATFRANETSGGSNFEAGDNFSAEIILDGGAPVSMMAPDLDRGNGVSSHVAVDGAEQANGPLNGWLNGYTQIAPVAPNAVQTAAENYNANIIRDEFNFPPAPLPEPQPMLAADSLDRTFQISYSVPDAVNTVTLSFRGGNDSASEFFTLSGVRVFNGACDMQALATGITRGIGANAGDPADDVISFNLLVSGNGATWTYGTFSGTYNTPLAVTMPVSESGLTQTVIDGIDGTCTSTFTVTAPQENLVVTAAIPRGTTFTAATAAGNAQGYARPPGGTELGWTGGDADVQARKQQDPNTTAFFLDMNGKTAAGDFLTEAAVIDPSLDFIRVSLDLGAYTTSGTSFEEDDSVVIAAEVSSDPAFPATVGATTQIFIYGTAFPPAATGGVAFYDDFKVSSPDAINYGTAAVPYPATDFALTRRSVVFARGANTYVRLRIAGGPSAAGSEHAIVDNILIERGTCELAASPVITRDNKNNDDPADDEFSANVTVTALANGASSGWVRVGEGTPVDGQYSTAVTFGPYLVSGGPVAVSIADNLDAACTLNFALTPPLCSLTIDTASTDSSVERNTNGTPDTVNDDTVSLRVTVTGANTGTGWTSNIPNPAVAGTFYSGSYGTEAAITIAYTAVPAPVIFRDLADAACTVNYTVPIPHAGTYNLGTFVPLTGAPVPVTSLTVPAPATPAAATWTNPADGVVAMVNPTVTPAPDPLIYVVNADNLVNPAGFNEILFTASLVVRETSATSNFEAADRFRILINYELAEGGSGSRNAISAHDSNGDGYMNGQDDAPAGAYNADPMKDEFNRPAPGVNQAGSIDHTFALSAVIPAGATLITFTIEGYNNSATEHYRVENILLTERLPDPNNDSDGDGVSNGAEAIMGTLPNDPTSVTRLAQSSTPGQFTFEGIIGRFYRVYVSDDGATPTHLTKWQDANQGTVTGAGPHTVTITPQAGVGRRFYRLHVRESDADWPPVVPVP